MEGEIKSQIRIASQIRDELKRNVDVKTRESFQRFFKEDVKCYGVKTHVVGKIADRFWPEISKLSKKETFMLFEELFGSGYTEDAFVVSSLAPKLIDRYDKGDIETFRAWIDRYIDNWAKCDGFCNHAVGDLIEKYPDLIGELKVWAKSSNRWLRRASAVSLIVPAKRGKYLDDAFEIADILLLDRDDMVQKGYGWLLKEESRLHENEVYGYVLRHRSDMPRTALRYAIELMPKDMRTEAMRRVA